MNVKPQRPLNKFAVFWMWQIPAFVMFLTADSRSFFQNFIHTIQALTFTAGEDSLFSIPYYLFFLAIHYYYQYNRSLMYITEFKLWAWGTPLFWLILQMSFLMKSKSDSLGEAFATIAIFYLVLMQGVLLWELFHPKQEMVSAPNAFKKLFPLGSMFVLAIFLTYYARGFLDLWG